MATDAQFEANRKNAQKSTGPRDTSKTRFNAIKHGVLSSQMHLSDEEWIEFQGLRDSLVEALQPKGILQEFALDELVSLRWRHRRLVANAEATSRSPKGMDGDVVGARMPFGDNLVHLQRYESHLTGRWDKLLKDYHSLGSIGYGRQPAEHAVPLKPPSAD